MLRSAHRNLLIICLLLPPGIRAQTTGALQISSRAQQGWIQLDSTWRYRVGDDPSWSAPDFDDRSWSTINLTESLDLTKVPGFPADQRIFWFRIALRIDSALTMDQLVLRVLQSGASEIFINGKLVHRFGVIGPEAESQFYNPSTQSVSFPTIGKDSALLAVRFLNMPAHLPVFSVFKKSFLSLSISTLSYGADDPVMQNRRIRFNRWNITLGVTVILCILYMAFYLFFPTQQVNLVFSLSSLFHALFMGAIVIEQNYHGPTFPVYFFQALFQSPHTLLTLYCFYRIFELKFGGIYWTLQAFAVISVPLAFVFDSQIVGPILGVFALFETVRIGVISVRKNKGAWIILIFGALSCTYWAIVTLSRLSLIDIPNIGAYLPFGFLLIPLSLAIYLGYSFGMTSISLRNKLGEVEQLSIEKEKILSDQNVVLEQQVKDRTAALNKSLEDLKSAQAMIVHNEKMASLGELTAGIAHEIQNPLNFVKNFSEVSTELMDEMKTELTAGNLPLATEIAGDVRQNLDKIVHHSKRADGIVKGMLQHSRASSGAKEPTDLNALCDEYLRLAFHGLRAKDKSINVSLVTDFDPTMGKANVIPQEIGRVILNLVNNAVYAVSERSKRGEVGYTPIVTLSTRKEGGKVIINVADNGTGIPPKVVDKIFQPFFTTKPTGEGNTGLGLSLSYDIVTKVHGGSLEVKSTEGQGATFEVKLPT